MNNKGTILVVDDAEASLNFLKEILVTEGYQVWPMASGELAIASVAASPPDLVVLDIVMPGMNGFEVLRWLKAREASRNIPVILLSAATETEQRVEGLKLGAVDFISKPFQPDELLVRVKTHLEISRLTRELKQRTTELETANNYLLNSEEKFRLIFEHAPLGILRFDNEGIITECNDNFINIIGSSRGALIGLNMLKLPDKRIVHILQGALQGRTEAFEGDYSSVTANKVTPVRVLFSPVFAKDGNFEGGIGIIEDITGRKRSEAALRESEQRYRNLFEANPQPMWVYDLQTLAFLTVNAAAVAHYGYSQEEFLAMSIADIRPEEDVPSLLKNVAAVTKGLDKAGEWRHQLKDGRIIDVEIVSHTIELAGRAAEVVLAYDITDRRRTEVAMREANERLSAIMDSINALIYVADMETYELLFMNKYGRDIWGDIEGKLCWKTLQKGQSGPCAFCTNDRLLNAEGASTGIYVWEFQNTNNGHYYDCRDQAIRWTDGRLVRIEIETDITVRKLAEEALVRSEAEFRRLSQEFNGLLDAIPDNLTLQDKDLKILWTNQGAAKGLGKRPEDLIGQHCYAMWHNRVSACEPCPVVKSFRTGEPASLVVTTPDNRTWDLRTIPLFDEQGRVSNVIEVGRDITERRRLEAQYLQSQKMESIGTLAGGIAHDFNNVLNAVVGFAGLLQMNMDSSDPLKHHVDEIMAAGQRGAMLTHQILAFSRKQVLDMQPVNLNELIRSLEKMLRRLLREDLSIELKLSDKDLFVMADASQIDQVVINLVTNARDAMPSGGKLGISTEHFVMDNGYIRMHGYGSPGEYALLTISDTGKGMSEETLKHIFEPFYTTKEVGKGTGLGLAVVHGIVKQHNGYINVYSEVGKGTVVKIYLPLTPHAAEKMIEITENPIKGGTETILIAEDDASLRKLSKTVLNHYGYKVIEAVDGEDAIRKFVENCEVIKLVILDGIMPNKNGKEVFDEIRKHCPDMKAIFVSGYAEDVFTHEGIPDKEAVFMQKPVKPDNLLRKVRETLDR